MTTNALMDRRNRLLGMGAPIFYEKPVNIVRGKGVWLYDDEGRRYLDMYNNVPCVGHCHPHVVEAMHSQAQTLNVHSRYLNEGVYSTTPNGWRIFTQIPLQASSSPARARKLTRWRWESPAPPPEGGASSAATLPTTATAAEVGKFTRVGQQAEEERADEIRAFPFPQRYRPSATACPTGN